MVEYFGQFNADGFPVGFYNTDVWEVEDIPADAIPLAYLEWRELIDNAGLRRMVDGVIVPYAPPTVVTEPPASRVYKAPMFRRMTDAEFDVYLQIRADFPPRIQAIFDSAEYLSSDDEFWPMLVAAAEQAYGEERAQEILAPSV